MTNFQDLKDRPDAFLSLTGYTLEELDRTITSFFLLFFRIYANTYP